VSTPKAESLLQNRIKKQLLAEWPGSWIVKIHGGPFQAAGIPDLVGCIEGRFVGLEVKLPDDSSRATKIQESTLSAIRRAGGLGTVVWSPAQAVAIVSEYLEETTDE